MTGLPWLAISLLLFPLSSVWSHAWLAGCSMLLLMSAAAWRRTRVLPEAGTGVTAKHVPLLWLLCLLQPVVRDWGRLSGMVRLHAWPEGRVVWPWRRRTPTMPARQHRGWSDDAFWSEDSLGRGELLQAMRALAPASGLIWNDAGEESACDAVLTHRTTFACVGVATVTEFHGGGRQLTRVATGPRFRWWLHPVNTALLAAAVASSLLHGPPGVTILHWLGFIAASWRSIRASGTARGLVLAAAARCGLCDDPAPPDITPEELHQRALASTGQSAEL
jgi:hypothetical protein